jgi:polyamine oxidase
MARALAFGASVALSVALTPSDGASPKIIIVGAGFAGLSAAKHLVSQGFTNLVIVEGRDRVGGRTWTDNSLGHPIDLGGAWYVMV